MKRKIQFQTQFLKKFKDFFMPLFYLVFKLNKKRVVCTNHKVTFQTKLDLSNNGERINSFFSEKMIIPEMSFFASAAKFRTSLLQSFHNLKKGSI